MNTDRVDELVSTLLEPYKGGEAIRSVADKIGVGPEQIRKYKRGENSLPMKNWRKFERALDLDKGLLARAAGVPELDLASIDDVQAMARHIASQSASLAAQAAELVSAIDELRS